MLPERARSSYIHAIRLYNKRTFVARVWIRAVSRHACSVCRFIFRRFNKIDLSNAMFVAGVETSVTAVKCSTRTGYTLALSYTVFITVRNIIILYTRIITINKRRARRVYARYTYHTHDVMRFISRASERAT